MKLFRLQEIHRSFVTDAIDIPAKSEIAMQFETPAKGLRPAGMRLVAVTSHRYDVSNAFEVSLFDERCLHFSGKLVDLSQTLLDRKEGGFALSEGSFTLLVKNVFDSDLRCPRLRFDFS